MLAGDEDSFWHFSLYRPPRPPIAETTASIRTPEHAVKAFEKLWQRTATFKGDTMPEELSQAIIQGMEQVYFKEN